MINLKGISQVKGDFPYQIKAFTALGDVIIKRESLPDGVMDRLNDVESAFKSFLNSKDLWMFSFSKKRKGEHLSFSFSWWVRENGLPIQKKVSDLIIAYEDDSKIKAVNLETAEKLKQTNNILLSISNLEEAVSELWVELNIPQSHQMKLI